MSLRAASRLFALSSGVALVGCSLVLKTDDGQCKVDADCDNRGGKFAGSLCVDGACVAPAGDPQWACLGKVVWTAPEPKTISWTVRIQELISKQPPKTLTVSACEKLDVDCTQPVVAGATPNAEGNIVLNVEAGFDGYLQILSDDTVPSYLNQVEPLLEDLPAGVPINLLTPGGLNLLASAGGFTIDPALGVTLVLTRDCTGQPAAGIRLRSDSMNSKTQAFYLVNGLPKTTIDVTDSSGNAGFINLPTGFVTLTTERADTGDLIGHAAVQIRGNSVSYVDLPPTP